MHAIVKIFVFISWHEIKKSSRQKVIHTFLSWLIQLLQGSTPNTVECVEKI